MVNGVNMHVVVIPSWYSNDENIVLGSFFKEQAIALKEEGIDVTVCYNEIFPIYRYDKFLNIFSKKIFKNIEDGLDTFRYRDFNYLLHSKRRFLLFSKRIERLINEVLMVKGKIDLLHFHSCFWAGICAPYVKKVFDIPYVITEHTSVVNSKKIKSSYLEYIYNAYKNADKLISVSNSLKNEMLNILNRDIEVIYNFIDGDIFKVINKKKNVINKKIVFFSLAFLVDGKGFEELIKASEYLIEKKCDFLLEIGGDGYLRKRLEKYVFNKKIEKYVKFLGILNREEVLLKMNECDVFVLPSYYETFGVVYIEALACGKPIIAVKNGGAEEIINENVGILLDDCHYIKIADAMKKMMYSIQTYKSTYIRKYFLSKFEKKVIIDKLKDVYKNCLNI